MTKKSRSVIADDPLRAMIPGIDGHIGTDARRLQLAIPHPLARQLEALLERRPGASLEDLALEGLWLTVERYLHCEQSTSPSPAADGVAFDRAKISYNAGVRLYSQGRIVEAIVEFRRAIESKPMAPEAHFCLGVCLHADGKLVEASKELRLFLDLAPESQATQDWREQAVRMLRDAD